MKSSCAITEIPMSLKRLTPDEWATYLLGLAVRRQFEEAPRDPDIVREIAAVARWMEHWLTWGELMIIEQETGFHAGDYTGDEVVNPVVIETPPIRREPPARSRPTFDDQRDDPDDIPF
jgi:hypothetical protein